MKNILPILLSCLIVGCATINSDPFVGLRPERVATIQVGGFKEGAAGRPEFIQYFRIDDPKTVQTLTSLLTTSDRIEPYLPGIGGLSWQRFLDEEGQPIAVTWIVNYGSRITVHRPDEVRGDGYILTYSEPFCRTVYDLMQKQCPDVIEKLDEHYQQVGQTLEGLLFGKKAEVHNKASQVTSQ